MIKLQKIKDIADPLVHQRHYTYMNEVGGISSEWGNMLLKLYD